MPTEPAAANQMSFQATPKSKPNAVRHIRYDSVNQLETDDYVCVAPATPLSKAIEVMKKDEGGCAIVCDNAGRVVGIFTERDVLTKVVGETANLNEPVSTWMSPIVATLDPEATIGDAVAIMNDKSYRNIPLVKNDKLVGSISVFDIISYLAESYPKATMNLPPNPDQVMDSAEGG